MDTLWAGWRSGYVRSADEQNEAGCLFCRLPGEDDATALILERGALAFSVLNRFPYTTGPPDGEPVPPRGRPRPT